MIFINISFYILNPNKTSILQYNNKIEPWICSSLEKWNWLLVHLWFLDIMGFPETYSLPQKSNPLTVKDHLVQWVNQFITDISISFYIFEPNDHSILKNSTIEPWICSSLEKWNCLSVHFWFTDTMGPLDPHTLSQRGNPSMV